MCSEAYKKQCLFLWHGSGKTGVQGSLGRMGNGKASW